MNGRIARGLRSRAKYDPNSKTEYQERRYQPTFRVDRGTGKPIYKMMPIRMAPGPRHLYKSLKSVYNKREDKKREVRFHPREGW